MSVPFWGKSEQDSGVDRIQDQIAPSTYFCLLAIIPHVAGSFAVQLTIP